MATLKPHMSEKSYALAGTGKYVFLIDKRSNKVTVKAEVEKLFKVTVTAVNIISIPGKLKRSKAGVSRRKDVRKAVVSLKSPDRIDLFDAEEPKETKKDKKTATPVDRGSTSSTESQSAKDNEIKTAVVKEAK